MSNRHPLIVASGGAIVDPVGNVFQPVSGSSVVYTNAQNLRNGERPFHPELQYLGLLQELVDKSDEEVREDRTGTGTYSVFGRQSASTSPKAFPLSRPKSSSREAS